MLINVNEPGRAPPLTFLLSSLLGFLVPTLACSAEVERTFHVAPAPAGNDAGDGSASRPFASPDRARVAVRDYLAAHELRGDVLVELAAGTYELPAPLRFEAADSGENGFDVVYRAAPGASVTLSGGRRVARWTQESAGLYQADVGRNVDFRQLWVNRTRAVRARTPNVGEMLEMPAEKQANGFDLPRAALAGVTLRPAEVEVSVLIAWMHKRLRIARLEDTADADRVRAVIEPAEWDGVTKQPQGDRVYLRRNYWLENARAFLDAPGEFFLDRADGILRYRSRPGEDLARAEVIRPELENLVILAGRPDAPVRHLRFEGLTFAHTGWTRPNRHGFVDVQANSLVPADPAGAVDAQYRHNQRKDRIPAAFQASTADRITIRDCRFLHLGGTGLQFTCGGDDNVIEGNAFVDLAAGGIELGEDAVRPAAPRLFPRRNRIANNFLTHIGEDYFGSVAILGYYTDASLITHNEISAVPYTGISQGWGWGNPPAPADSRANRITHNRVTNFMRRLDDGGGIYTTDRLLGSEIAGNFIADMLPPDAHTKAGGAIYPDQFTEGVHIHHNVVAGALRWLFLWNPNIRGNRVETNYADTDAHRNDAPDNAVEPVHLVADRDWPEPARAILATAGLEPAFARVHELPLPDDFIVESTGMDFQPIAGTWTPSAATERIGLPARQSTDPNATARWVPLVPHAGTYALDLWRPRGGEPLTVTITHAHGSTPVTVPATSSAGWVSLGHFPLKAGPGNEVEVRRTAPATTPLVLDALRCRRSERDGR